MPRKTDASVLENLAEKLKYLIADKKETYAIFCPAAVELYIEHLNSGPLNCAASHAALWK